MPTLQKVKPGDPLSIPASTYNAFVDAARTFLAGSQRRNGDSSVATSQIFIRNDSGSDRKRFDILGIDDTLYDPSSDLAAFQNQPVLTGITPTVDDHVGKFAILLEPIAAGGIGQACISGICPVQIEMQQEEDQFADVGDSPASLKSGNSGSAFILWCAEGTGTVWALVRLASGTVGTAKNPKVLEGDGAEADDETWSVTSQEDGYDGVKFTPIRLYWSGNSGDPIYQFIRTPTYDSVGKLIAVSAEVRTEAFTTGPCEET